MFHAEKTVRVKLLFLICLLFCINISAQTDLGVQVEEIYLARDNGKGKAGEIVESFLTNDIPIHCIVQLDSMKPVTVKMIFVATNVTGVKPETKVIAVNYTTNGSQTQVNFTGKPEKNWFAGNYRIDIFINDKSAKSLDFEIKKSPQPAEKEKQTAHKLKTISSRKLKKN